MWKSGANLFKYFNPRTTGVALRIAEAKGPHSQLFPRIMSKSSSRLHSTTQRHVSVFATHGFSQFNNRKAQSKEHPVTCVTPIARPTQYQWLMFNERIRISPQNRGLLHIPFLGILSPKVLAVLALKKTVVLAIIQKYGVKGTFDLLRQSNEQLAKDLGATRYPNAAKQAVNVGLDALEMGVSKLQPHEQAEVLWKWLKSVDPTLAIETLKRYVNLTPQPSAGETKEEKSQSEEEIRMIKMITESFPEVSSKYDIVLVEKDPTPDQSNFNTRAGKAEGTL